MTFLPIVARELRVTARQRGTYWVRLLVAAQATFVAMAAWVITALNPTMKFGTALFWGLAAVAMIHCLLAGRRSTADALSQEKRDGTIGLLFLTDLRAFDVVIGKLVATSLGGFYGLLAIFPVLAVPLLVGGMTSGELWRMALALLVTFIFSLAIGVRCSAGAWDYKEAIGRNFLVLMTLTVIVPMLGAVAQGAPRNSMFFLACPFFTFHLCADAPYLAGRSYYWGSLGLMLGLSYWFIARACRMLPKTWQDQPVPKAGWFKSWRAFKRFITYGGAQRQAWFRKWALDRNAYFWLAARERLKPAHVWAFLAGAAVWWATGFVANEHYWLNEISDVIMAVLLTASLKLWVTVEAGQRLALDREIGAMELLLCSPLTVQDFLQGQFLALRRQFLAPLIFVVVAMVALAVAALTHHPENGWLLWAGGIIMLVADILTLSVVGIWTSLWCKTHTRATLAAALRILVAPWVGVGLVALAIQALEYVGLDDVPPRFLEGTWFCFGIGTDIFFGWKAWRHLQLDFRDTAMQRYGLRAKIERRGPKWKWRRRPAVAVGVGAAAIIACVAWAKSGPHYPPPVVVTLTSNKAPLKVFPSFSDGLFIILPDGTLWRWGKPEGPFFARAASPEQIGTNRDWVKIEMFRERVLGLRGNGTIWEWGTMRNGQMIAAPEQRDMNDTWADIAASGNLRVALRRDGTLWSWARTTNSGGGFRMRAPHQAGTETNWAKVISVGRSAIFAVKRDGSVWTWPDYQNPTFEEPARTTQDVSGLPENWLGSRRQGWPFLTLGLDGSLWTQGADYGLDSFSLPFVTRVKLLQAKLAGIPNPNVPLPGYDEVSRPLMKFRYP